MASLDITSTYNGEGAEGYISAAILSADTLAENLVTSHTGIKKKLTIQKLDSGDIQSYACAFTPVTDEVTITEAVLEPTNLMRNIEVCKSEFYEAWNALQTGNGRAGIQVPQNFNDFLVQHLAAKVAAGIEKAIWRGNYNETDGSASGGTSVSYFDGLLHRVVDATPAYEKEATGAFTADNHATTGILTHLVDLVGNMPDAIDGDPETEIFMSRKALSQLHIAMSSVGVAGGYTPFLGEGRPATYLGYNLVVPSGMPADTLLATKRENLHFGTDLMSDFNAVNIVDMSETTGDDKIRMRMNFCGATQVGFESDIAVVRRES